MAENDQNAPKQETTELEALAAENKEIKNDVTRGQKYVMWGMIAVSVIAVLTVIYIFAIRNPAVKAANEAVAQADMTMTQGNDSLALAQYQQVAKEYGYDAGNNASLMAATLLYKKGEYQQAIDQLKNYSPAEAIVGAAAQSLEGDCYVNLDQYDKAISCYRTAESRADGNPAIVPFILVKEANVFRAQENYGAEAEAYRKIIDKFPNYSAGQVDIRTLYNRALTQSRQ